MKPLTSLEKAKIHAEVADAAKVLLNESSRAWKAAHPERVRSYAKRYAKRNRPELNANERFNRKFGPTAEARKIKAKAYQKAYQAKMRAEGAYKRGGRYYRSYDALRDAPRRRRNYLAMLERRKTPGTRQPPAARIGSQSVRDL